MTVLEISPGAGYYADILSAYLAAGEVNAESTPEASGTYMATAYPETSDRRIAANAKFKAKYPNAIVSVMGGEARLPEGVADRVLTFRNVHNWMGAGTAEDVTVISDDASTDLSDNDSNIIILHGGATTFASAEAAVDAFEAAGAFSLTHENTIAEDDAFLFAYENSTTGVVHVAVASFNAADDEDGGADVIDDGILNGTDLVSLSGVTDVTTLDAADFNFIA